MEAIVLNTLYETINIKTNCYLGLVQQVPQLALYCSYKTSKEIKQQKEKEYTALAARVEKVHDLKKYKELISTLPRLADHASTFNTSLASMSQLSLFKSLFPTLSPYTQPTPISGSENSTHTASSTTNSFTPFPHVSPPLSLFSTSHSLTGILANAMISSDTLAASSTRQISTFPPSTHSCNTQQHTCTPTRTLLAPSQQSQTLDSTQTQLSSASIASPYTQDELTNSMECDSSTSKPTSPMLAALTLTHTPFTPEITTNNYPVIATSCLGTSYSFIDPPLAATCQAKITTTKHAVQCS